MDDQIELLKHIYQEDLFVVDEPEVDKKPIKSIPSSETRNEGLVVSNTPDLPVVSEPVPITFLGENNKGILILVNDTASEFLNAQDLDLLMKIIEAGLKFSKKDIALVNLSKYDVEQVIKKIPHNYLISFGTGAVISNGKPLNEIIEFHGKKTLFSHQLHEISMDIEKKKQLWKALQSMFNI